MTKLITVRAKGDDNRVALWEKHPAHPGGEVFIVAGQTAQVAKTPQVRALLERGVLIQEEKSAAPKPVAPEPAEAQEKPVAAKPAARKPAVKEDGEK